MRTLRNIGNFQVKIHSQDAGSKSQQAEVISTYKEECSVLNHSTWACSIWDLPESVLICILHGIHIRDLLSFRQTHSYFRNIIDNSGSVWTNVSFADLWPSEITIPIFSRAAERRNLEAVVKLAVSYLYKEGQTAEDASVTSLKAAHYLCEAERLTPNTFPFFWIFIRPPWSPEGSCCKLMTFQHIKDTLEKIDNPDVTFGTALILKLQRLTAKEEFRLEEDKYFKMAVDQKSAAGAFFSLMDALNEPDKGKELEKVRLLRQIASCNILEAKLNLIRYYTHGFYGGISEMKAKEYVRDFFMSSEPSRIHVIFSANLTTVFSRYILIDWLVEVVGMKGFSAHVLYFAVSLFDRFLQVRTIRRSQVQLLGVAAIVVSSRFLGFEILTIREAAWLTDNSYTYYDVVRMMGELVATLRGNLRALTIQDYTKVLLTIVNEEGYAGVLTEYISMLCLLQAEMGQYSPAEIAASCLLLSRILVNYTEVWPTVLKEWTGFSQDYLSLCTYHIFNKCLVEGSAMAYKDTILQAVKTRYADPLRYSVSNIKLIGHKELCRRLGVTRLISHGKDTKSIQFRNTDELVMSSRYAMRLNYLRSIDEAWVDRDNAATPMNNEFVMDEGVSGYEGDLESESDDSCEKSETIFDDQDISAIADASDDSKHWYSCSEDNHADDSLDEAELAIQDMVDSQADKTLEADGNSKIACLSSMCQSGANLACHSSLSFPSSCISNCSCKKSYSSTSTITSGLSLSSPLLVFPSADPSSSSSFISSPSQGNVRSCLPCGSINATSKGSRRNRLDECSNSCDILSFNNQVCDDATSKGSECYFMRKAHSSDDIRMLANHAVDNSTEASFDGTPHQCESAGALSTDKPDSPSIHDDSTYQSSLLGNVQLHTPDTTFNMKSSSSNSSNRSQGSGCNNSNSIYTSNDIRTQGSNSVHLLSLQSCSPSSAQDSDSNQQPLNQLYCEELSNACSPLPSYKSINLVQDSEENYDHVFDSIKDDISNDSTFYISSRQLKLKCSSRHDSVQMPGTPESVPDIQKFTNRASSLVRSHDSFDLSSFNEANTTRFTSKKARLEYSGSISASVDFALKQLDLSFDSVCGKTEECGLPGCISETLDSDLDQISCSGDGNSKLTLKRKSCQ